LHTRALMAYLSGAYLTCKKIRRYVIIFNV
jgi:hypothetical protein